MNGKMIKVYDVVKVNDKAPVCLKKTVFGEQIQPVIHSINRIKILLNSMYNYFSALCFYSNNLRGRKRI